MKWLVFMDGVKGLFGSEMSINRRNSFEYFLIMIKKNAFFFIFSSKCKSQPIYVSFFMVKYELIKLLQMTNKKTHNLLITSVFLKSPFKSWSNAVFPANYTHFHGHTVWSVRGTLAKKPNLAHKMTSEKRGSLQVIFWTCCMWGTFCSAALTFRAPLCFQLVAAAAGRLSTLTPLLKEYTHTYTHSVIAYFLTSFNASVAPGVTRHGLLSYTWPGWVTPLHQLLSNHRTVLFPPAQD